MRPLRFFDTVLVAGFYLALLWNTVSSLKCHQCDGRDTTENWCRSPKEVQCKDGTHICYKSVSSHARSGMPNIIKAGCMSRQVFQQNLIDACQKHYQRADQARGTYEQTSEKCTCSKDMCNSKELNTDNFKDLMDDKSQETGSTNENDPNEGGESGEGAEGNTDEGNTDEGSGGDVDKAAALNSSLTTMPGGARSALTGPCLWVVPLSLFAIVKRVFV